MASIILKGLITADGHLEVELPPDVEPGQVEIEIRRPLVEGVTLGQLLESGLVGVWAERNDIQDNVEFARELRQKAFRRWTE